MVDNNRLSWKQRRLLIVLGLPAFGISLAYTLVTTYLPVLIAQLSGPTLTGVLIGGEGLFALFLPILVGAWSDSLRTRLGGRLPFIIVGTVLAIAALIAMPFSAGSLVFISMALTLFFVAYFIYYSPYYALFPDLVPVGMRGRSQGVQGAFRSVGMLLAMAGGGFLLYLWRPLPFLVAVAAIVGVTAVLFIGVRDRLESDEEGSYRPGQSAWITDWHLVRDNEKVRLWVISNSLWEATIATLRTFVVLYLTVGLNLSLQRASGALALAGVVAILAAPLSGKLADRYGHGPVMIVALWTFGLGLLLPLISTSTYLIVAAVPIAFAAVVLMTLPYSVLMGLLPGKEHHGAGAALFGFSRGVGILLGPLLAGIAINLLQPVDILAFGQTEGYAAMFGVASVFLLISIPLLRRMNIDGKSPE